MALLPCPECRREISDKAKVCPLCGNPVKRQDPTGRVIYWIGGILVASFLVQHQIEVWRRGPEPAQATPVAARTTNEDMTIAFACEAALKAVRARLKAPSTADFPSCTWSASEYTVRATPDRSRFWVSGHVDAQNAYGAKLRQQFIVELTKGPGESTAAFTPVKAEIE